MTKPACILHVDDDAFIRTIIHRALTSGFEVVSVETGQAALDWLGQGHVPALVLTDLSMPDVDGWALMDWVKASPLHQSVPIIILAGNRESELKIRCLAAGAVDVLEKPFNPHWLKARLKALLRLLAGGPYLASPWAASPPVEHEREAGWINDSSSAQLG